MSEHKAALRLIQLEQDGVALTAEDIITYVREAMAERARLAIESHVVSEYHERCRCTEDNET